MATIAIENLSAKVRALCAGASIETAADDLAGLEKAAPYLTPGSDISITWMPNDALESRVAASLAIREAGFEPVPHIAARHIETHEAFERVLKDMAQKAGVKRLFLIAGDVDRIKGPFATANDLIDSGLIGQAGIREVGISAYPEGHPKIDDASLRAAFDDKLAAAKIHGLEIFAITQLCFEAPPIIAMIKDLRARGFDRPIRVGLAGPASLKTLARFALICGVGNSAKAMFSKGGMIAKLLKETGPDPVIRALAAEDLDALGPIALHFFPFGGLAKTARWSRTVADGRFTLPPRHDGFEVEKD
jgi:methylenetetrahydrofolate reductase (NADPH)